jgi:Tfp pilus assembly protein PilV
MEVLASMFVICIGLLGVLAVIPYGAYQTAKAKNAENTSWLLDAAVKELQTMELAKPENWWTVHHNTDPYQSVDNATPTNPVNIFLNHTTPDDRELNCSRFLMVDPFVSVNTPLFDLSHSTHSNHIYRVGANFTHRPLFCDRMTGQDDLVYTTHSDKRTDFSGQDSKILSSGQYTWFFMFRPEVIGSPTPITQVHWSSINTTNTNVDILGCYNRVSGTEQIIDRSPSDYTTFYGNSALIRIPSGDYDFKNTKYVFLSWVTDSQPDGRWYKVINVTEPTDPNRSIFLTLPNDVVGSIYPETVNFQILIIPGVMYYRQVRNVPIR